MSSSNGWIHIPTPGDHYSPATGSAVITVIYELNRCHEQAGGKVRVIVGRHTLTDYMVGKTTRVDFAPAPTKAQKIFDIGSGMVGFARRNGIREYGPALAGIPTDFQGWVFIHNNPVAVRFIKLHRPLAKVCLWLHNHTTRYYSNHEVCAIMPKLDRVICVSEYIARKFRQSLQRGAERVHVVYNGVDVERFCPAEPGAPTDNDKEVVILYVGKVVPQKGVDLLVRAACAIQDGHRKFRLRIVGSQGFNGQAPLSAYEQELRRLSRPLGAAVTYRPSVDRTEILQEYQQASIFCAPANWDEPFGLTVSEAISCGLPTVTSRRGGLPEVGGDAVLYCQTPTVAELAAQLAKLVDDPALRRELSRKARQRAETFTWQKQYQSLVTILAD